MLLEELVRKAAEPPEFDWEEYYHWYFSRLAGREVTGVKYWQCPACHTVNPVYLPARHATCGGCGVIQLA